MFRPWILRPGWGLHEGHSKESTSACAIQSKTTRKDERTMNEFMILALQLHGYVILFSVARRVCVYNHQSTMEDP